MTSPNGVDKLKDTGEREAAGDDERFAHFFRCWDRPGGPGYELREEVDGIKSGFVDMTATVRTWGRAIAGAVTLLTLAVAMLGYLQTREKDRAEKHAQSPATLINQAHAETKGTK